VGGLVAAHLGRLVAPARLALGAGFLDLLVLLGQFQDLSLADLGGGPGFEGQGGGWGGGTGQRRVQRLGPWWGGETGLCLGPCRVLFEGGLVLLLGQQGEEG